MRPLACAAWVLILACDSGNRTTHAGTDGAIADGGRSNLGDDTEETGASNIDAGPPQLVVTPTTLFLQAMSPIGAWDSASLVIANPGGSPTGPLLASLSGPDVADFSLHRENCPSGLAPGQRCTSWIDFQPEDVQPDPNLGAEAHATLTIADSEPSGLVATVDITAVTLVASEGLALVGPPDMGKVQLGAAGDSLPFIVVNTGSDDSGALRISLSSPQFAKTVDQCSGNSLASAETCSFAVQFVPANLGFQWAILTIQGSAEHMVASEIVSGNGGGP
jgi:hypothetical protein